MFMENMRLKEQLIALRLDARRYRWLRERDNFPGDEGDGPSLWDQLCDLECDEFDQFIDKAMAEQEKPAAAGGSET